MFSAVLMSFVCIAAQASGTAGNALEPQVQQLVLELNSNQLSTREDAEQALMELGPEALEYLPTATSRLPAETQQRLARVRNVLEKRLAVASAEGTTVTLPEAKRPLSEYLAAISEATGNEILDYRDQFGQVADDPLFELGFDGVPFWQALDELLDAANLTVYPYVREAAVAIVGRSEGQSDRSNSAHYSGAFRIEPVDLVARRDLRNPDLHTLRLRIEVGWEPRLRPIAIRQSLDKLEADDGQGERIVVAGDDVELEANIGQGMTTTELELPFVPPPRSVAKIGRLVGVLDALVPGAVEAFRFEQLAMAKRAAQTRAGVTVTLEEVRKNNEVWEVRVTVRFDETFGALASHRGWIFKNEAHLEGLGGEIVSSGGFETLRHTEQEVGMAYYFDVENLDGYTFVYKTPAAIVDASVEYWLTDLELP